MLVIDLFNDVAPILEGLQAITKTWNKDNFFCFYLLETPGSCVVEDLGPLLLVHFIVEINECVWHSS